MNLIILEFLLASFFQDILLLLPPSPIVDSCVCEGEPSAMSPIISSGISARVEIHPLLH